jgi:methylamine dehydrogenase light chain
MFNMLFRNKFDKNFELYARDVAKRSSRRSFLARIGTVLLGAATLPLLPIYRAVAQTDNALDDARITGVEGDPDNCDYWRYCALDGFLSSCCGGTHTSCPPGTEMSPVTWIGTCRNPNDGRNYLISYNDCCGISACGRCFCDENEGDQPIYNTPKSNDINWCLANNSTAYNSTVALVLGVVEES